MSTEEEKETRLSVRLDDGVARKARTLAGALGLPMTGYVARAVTEQVRRDAEDPEVRGALDALFSDG